MHTHVNQTSIYTPGQEWTISWGHPETVDLQSQHYGLVIITDVVFDTLGSFVHPFTHSFLISCNIYVYMYLLHCAPRNICTILWI
jgi:hypothetical protein